MHNDIRDLEETCSEVRSGFIQSQVIRRRRRIPGQMPVMTEAYGRTLLTPRHTRQYGYVNRVAELFEIGAVVICDQL